MRYLSSVMVCWIVWASTATAASPAVRYVLLDSKANLRAESFELTPADVPGLDASAGWSIRTKALHGGKQEGVDLLIVDNGRMQIVIIPTRGLGILEVVCDDVRLGWNSPVREVVHPQWVDLDSRRGLGWLDGFNEWMARCGLEFAGHPGTDRFVTNTGEVAEMELSLHGKIANLPASHVEVLVDRQPPHRLRIRGRVDERMFFGPQLELWSEISTVPGSTALRIEDRVRNAGGNEQEFELIYHCNFGPPLLEKGARFVAAVEHVAPMNDHAAEGIERFDRYAGPTPGWIEKVYLMKPYADAKGRTTILLRNARASRGAALSYAVDELPYLTLWKNTADPATGYVTGIEPGTSHPYNRRVERHFGRVPRLAAGQSRTFRLDVEVLLDQKAVTRAAETIERIRGGRPTRLETRPPEIPGESSSDE